MIQLGRFLAEKQVIMPIVGGWGQINGRKVYKPDLENGWYIVLLSSLPSVIRKTTPLEIFKTLKEKKFLIGYVLGTEIVPVSFDNLVQRGFGETIPVNFLNLPLYEVAKIVQWEDNRWYFYEPDVRFQRTLLKQMQEVFNNEQELGNIKGITPELRYLFLLTTLQRDAFRAAEQLEKLKLSELERAKRIKEFESTFAGRLQTTIERAGGTLVKFYKANSDTYMVHWKVKDSEQLVKSSIKDNLQILNLGFCASNHDREHTLASAVQLAKMYGDLYITRE